MSRFYQIHEFAELAGVTVKALHHYDRLGLLEPKRTDGGYRMYTERDLERLEQIIALKFLRRRFYERGPSREWRELYRDVAAALGEDPASAVAQALADRWLKLGLRAYNGEPEFQTDSPTAWMDREHWPPFMKRRIAEFKLEDVNRYISQVVLSSRKKYFSGPGWVKFVETRKDPAQISVIWQSRVDLFREVESYLGEDPASEKAQALAVRWTAHMDAASGGNPEVKAGLRKAWADRQNWTATVRYLEEGLSMMSGERFDKAAAFIDKSCGSQRDANRRTPLTTNSDSAVAISKEKAGAKAVQLNAMTTAKNESKATPALVCNLSAISAAERPRYTDLVRRLRGAMRERSELPDGYAFRLDSKAITLPEVAEWMSMERLCCPFLSLKLSAVGNQADWFLNLTGPEGIKPMFGAAFPGR